MESHRRSLCLTLTRVNLSLAGHEQDFGTASSTRRLGALEERPPPGWAANSGDGLGRAGRKDSGTAASSAGQSPFSPRQTCAPVCRPAYCLGEWGLPRLSSKDFAWIALPNRKPATPPSMRTLRTVAVCSKPSTRLRFVICKQKSFDLKKETRPRTARQMSRPCIKPLL